MMKQLMHFYNIVLVTTVLCFVFVFFIISYVQKTTVGNHV